jgi:hypothetical protein
VNAAAAVPGIVGGGPAGGSLRRDSRKANKSRQSERGRTHHNGQRNNRSHHQETKHHITPGGVWPERNSITRKLVSGTRNDKCASQLDGQLLAALKSRCTALNKGESWHVEHGGPPFCNFVSPVKSALPAAISA